MRWYRSDLVRLSAIVLLAVTLSACGRKVSGVYLPEDGGMFEKINFVSGSKVQITFMGSTTEGTYKIEDGQVKITVNGQTQVFERPDAKTIDGGGILGRYAKVK